MKKRWFWIIGIVVVIGLVAIAYTLTQANSDSEEKEGYDTYEVEKESPIRLEGKASPSAIKTYNQNDEIGTYISTQVSDGQEVKQGEPIVNYDINNNKRKQLVDKLNETEDEYAKAEAQQELNKYDKMVNDSIYAAFDGTVEIENDGEAASGQPILQLVSNEPQIKSTVSEFEVGKIKEGDEVDIEVTSTGEKGKGKINKISELPESYKENTNSASGGEGAEGGVSNPVTEVSGEDDESVSKYGVTIKDIDMSVRIGFSTEVKIPLDTIKIPKSVLAKGNHVFVLGEGKKVEKRQLKIEKVNGEIFVKDGLKQGDKLIKNPKKNMNNGEKVEVAS